ncbi:phosphoesterase [Bacillus cereus VD133]|uniref:Phosphoesterase n=2 Tax=Bacillus cereus TaxID=1396 RepID=A0A9W5PL72_BACCE|nr:metallophosphoesterase [Bacillus cereus]EOO27151.1 phosphoesterase [Bacillus cereus VD133]
MRRNGIIVIFLTTLVLLVSVYSYAHYYEPKTISITCNQIKNKNIPKGFQGVKIVQFSDTHLGPNFTHEQLMKLVDQINRLKPDIVVFTGDLIDNFAEYGSQRKEAQPILGQIHANLGKYAVFGNHDRGGGGSFLFKGFMEEAGFTVLVNQIDKITVANGDQITIAGLDDFLLGKPKVRDTLHQLKPKDFNLLLVHEPDIVDEALEYPIDLQISGHSHGGQVQLPFGKPIISTSLGKKYMEGLYSLEGKNKNLQLYVNRGIGTTRAKVRFLCKPELSVFLLQQTDDGLKSKSICS